MKKICQFAVEQRKKKLHKIKHYHHYRYTVFELGDDDISSEGSEASSESDSEEDIISTTELITAEELTSDSEYITNTNTRPRFKNHFPIYRLMQNAF